MKKLIICLLALFCGSVAFAQKGISEIESGTMEDATLYDPAGEPIANCGVVTAIAAEDSGRRLILTQIVAGRQVMIEQIYEREGYFHPVFDSAGTLIKIEVYDAGKDYPSLVFEPTSVDDAQPSYQCVISVDPKTKYCVRKTENDNHHCA